MQTCKTCQFGIFHEQVEWPDLPGFPMGADYIECRRYPKSSDKRPEYWCGEHKPKEQSA